MKWLNWVNPAKSLFLRVFFGFWLSVVAIFIGSMWLVKHLDSDIRYLPLNSKQQADLTNAVQRTQARIDRRDSAIDVNKLITQWSNRNRFGLLLINTQTREIIHSNRLKRGIDKKLLENINQDSPPLLIEFEGAALLGPKLLRGKKVDYLLFVHVPRPIGNLRLIRHQYPLVFVLLLLTLSGALCYLFVRGLLKPITQLRLASKRMASGEMGVKIETIGLRADEIGQLGRDFNDMSEQVESLMLAQKRLLADISHELRSPLARLQLAIGIAQQERPDKASGSVNLALERIEKEALQIEKMIAQVLLLSRLDNALPIRSMQALDLVQLMSPIIADAKFEAEQNGKQLHYQLQRNVSFQGDQALLSSAIENVLRNAICYSKSVVDVQILVSDTHINWQIRDDGDGCSDEQLDKLFEAFYRVSSARDRHTGGVGLGLAIAQRAIIKHNGKIHAENGRTGGLLVVISIPFVGA